MKINFRKNKNFFTIIFVIVAIILILVTYYAVKQQQIIKSRAAIDVNNGTCNTTGACLPEKALCDPNGGQTNCCSGLICILNEEIPTTLSLRGICSPEPTNTPVIESPTPQTPTNTPVPTLTPTRTPTPIGPTYTPTPTSQTPTLTPTRTPTPTTAVNTPTPIPGTTNIDLELKLSFQGITADSPPEALTTDVQYVKVSIVDDKGSYIPINNQSIPVYVDENRLWIGQITINNIPLTELNQEKFYILIKGPRHIQKKICDAQPTEGESGYYSCQFGNIAFTQGLNTFDFSGIRLLAGDLPIEEGASQDGNINSKDLAMLKNLIDKDDSLITSDDLINADLDLNGKIEAHDWSLMIESLEVKYDEK